MSKIILKGLRDALIIFILGTLMAHTPSAELNLCMDLNSISTLKMLKTGNFTVTMYHDPACETTLNDRLQIFWNNEGEYVEVNLPFSKDSKDDESSFQFVNVCVEILDGGKRTIRYSCIECPAQSIDVCVEQDDFEIVRSEIVRHGTNGVIYCKDCRVYSAKKLGQGLLCLANIFDNSRYQMFFRLEYKNYKWGVKELGVTRVDLPEETSAPKYYVSPAKREDGSLAI